MRDKLPVGWVLVPIGDIMEVVQGQSPASSSYNEEMRGMPFFQGKTEFGDLYPTVRKWCTEPQKLQKKIVFLFLLELLSVLLT